MNTADLGPCLELDVGHDDYGYAMLYRDGKMVRAHRQAWIDAHGPLPSKTLVCHSCDNPRCSRLSHLFIGSNKANSQDMLAKGRSGRAGKPQSAATKEKMSLAKRGRAHSAEHKQANRDAQLKRWAARKASLPSNLSNQPSHP